MQTSEPATELWTALLAARREFKPVVKDSQAQIGSGRSYSYADLSTLLDAVLPALLAHGLLVVQNVDAESSTLVSRIVHAPSSQYLEARYPLNLDQPPQGLGSAITYSRRYQLLALLSVAAEDDDGAAAQAAAPVAASPAPRRAGSDRPISAPQVKKFWAVAHEHKWTSAEALQLLLFRYKVEHVDAIKADTFDGILRQLQQGPPKPEADDDQPF